MASRGARARKVTEKQIHKEEKKNVEKDRAERFARVHSPAKNIRPISPISPNPWSRKTPTVLSSNVSVTSSGSNNSGLSSTVASKISSKISSTDETKKYVTSGKTTAHPRGRRGGVPLKIASVEARPASKANLSFENRTQSISSGSGVQMPSASPEQSWANTKVYFGEGQAPKLYAGFEHDDDMWMADGDCLIFFSEETDQEDPRPVLRVHTRMLEQAKSNFMINLLRYGEIVREDDHSQSYSASSSPSPWPLTSTSLGNLDELLSHVSPNSPINLDELRPPRTPDTRPHNPHRDTWSTSDQTIWSPGGQPDHRPRTGAGSVRVPMSVAESVTAFSMAGSEYGDQNDEPSGPTEITHEIWFRAPSHIKRADIQRRHHMATRNYLALLYGLPIIGNDFYEMLSDLQNVMDTYYELNESSERWNSAQVIVQYLSQRKLDDVRGNISQALGLLAWSEQPNVLWDAGYLEAFVHCVGMMTQATMKTRDYRNLSQVTRHKLQMAYNAMQLRLIEAEERLSRFDFPEMWYVDGVSSNHPTQKSFDAFREFLFGFYETEYQRWPPADEDHQSHWLNRSLMTRLQADFGAIYNYWVDRDIVWDANEERPSRKWEMVPKRLRAGGFEADGPGFPITDMLIGFDSSQKYDHIPYPYALLPVSRAPSPKQRSTRKNLLNKFRSKDKDRGLPDVKAQYQMALAFNQASNINRLGTTFEDNKLLDELGNYEKSTQIPGVNPSDARLGRWVLLYGILQVLSTISVDTAGLKYKDKIHYYISTSLEGCPPWRSPDAAPLMIEACQQRSYCWLAPQTWGDVRVNVPPAYSNHQYELTEVASPTELDGGNLHRNRSMLQTATMTGPAGSNRSGVLRSPTLTPSQLSPNLGGDSKRRVSPSSGLSDVSSKRLGPGLMDDDFSHE